MLLATALALLITGCAQQTFTVQNKPAAVAPRNHHPSFLRLELGRRKLSMQPKFVAAQKNVVKTETQQTFVNGLLGFITLVFILRWKRVFAHTLHELPIDMATLSALLINILRVPSSCFCIVISLFSEGEIIPFSGVCQFPGGCNEIHAGGRLHALTDRLLWCANGRRPAATSSRRASFSALASANSFVYFASSAATSCWRICMSVIAAFASFSSSAFCLPGL